MEESTKLSRARRELEDLYLGIPDDSVNLTFGNLAEVKQHAGLPLNPMPESKSNDATVSPLSKLPSLDFNRALGRPTTVETHTNQRHQQSHHALDEADLHRGFRGHGLHNKNNLVDHHAGGTGGYSNSPRRNVRTVDLGSTANYDDMSYMSGMSLASASTYPHGAGGGRRRHGIPHSNICTICSNYIYICRHRCLVCGRVYCRQCVGIGMGEMLEGRKCIECLGRRFSQRYIQEAGHMGYCIRFRYSSMVKLQELKWAEKGPRKSGERLYEQSTVMSRSRNSMIPTTPKRAHGNLNSPSFVMNSPKSPYSYTNNPPPF